MPGSRWQQKLIARSIASKNIALYHARLNRSYWFNCIAAQQAAILNPVLTSVDHDLAKYTGIL